MTAAAAWTGASLTARLTALFALIAVLALAVCGVASVHALESHFAERDAEELAGKLELVGNLAHHMGSADGDQTLRDRLEEAFVGHGELTAIVLADERVLFEAGDPAAAAALRARASALDATARLLDLGDRRLRAVAADLPRPAHAQRLRAVIGLDIAHHVAFVRSFAQALTAWVALIALVSALLGWAAVRRGLRPLQDMKARAASVTAGQPGVRMPVESVPAELAELADGLNTMLQRLEDAFQRLADFSSDIAHELRTPVSNLMTQTQVALSQARSPEVYRDVLASNAEEFERLTKMISDMLFLAKADHGLVLPERVEVDLAAEVQSLFDYYEALAEDRGVGLQLTGQGRVRGDRLMLRRAISNLLSNALRHAPRGTSVAVSVVQSAGTVSVRVLNQGEPIASQMLPHVFDRFFRSESDRGHRAQVDGEGAGLGLALTRSIAQAHGGRTSARSGGDGTAFTIELPRAPADVHPGPP